MKTASLLVLSLIVVRAFIIPRVHTTRRYPPSLVLKSGPDSEQGSDLTKVGSKEYYEGFLKSDLRDDSVNTSERGDGLEQALKLGLYTGGFLVLLVVGFLTSNGLLF